MDSLYARLLEGVALPVYYGLQGRQYGRFRNFLERSQWWSRDRLLAYQWDQTRALLQHAFCSCPFYQRKYGAEGIAFQDIRSRDDFSRLPVLTREELNRHKDELCSTAFRGNLLPKSTGGSSGAPAHFYITTESFDWRMAATSRAYAWSGCHLGERTIYLWGAPVGKQSSWQTLKLAAYRRLRREHTFNTFVQNPEIWESIRKKAQAARPRYLVGFVSSLENFARFLLEQHRHLPGLRGVLAAAEPLYPHIRELLECAFEAPVYNTYGSREFMSIAAECPKYHRMHINCENLLVEGTGGSDCTSLLVTDLHNYGMPFIRYQIGDVGTLDSAVCSCGRGLPMLKSLDGRVSSAIRRSDGQVVSGLIFPHIIKEFPEVREFQIRQESDSNLLVLMVLARPLSSAKERLLQVELGKAVGCSFSISLKVTERIPAAPSGKRQLVVPLQTARTL